MRQCVGGEIPPALAIASPRQLPPNSCLHSNSVSHHAVEKGQATHSVGQKKKATLFALFCGHLPHSILQDDN